MLIATILLSALIIVGAVWVVALQNLFRAALSLGVVLLGIAGLFLVLEAEFLAFVQILVYVGAILTLVVFAIMLTAKLHLPGAAPISRKRLPAALASGALFALLASMSVTWTQASNPPEPAVALETLGQQLVTTLVLPFEVISLVLVASLVGAVAIAAQPSSSAR